MIEIPEKVTRNLKIGSPKIIKIADANQKRDFRPGLIFMEIQNTM